MDQSYLKTSDASSCIHGIGCVSIAYIFDRPTDCKRKPKLNWKITYRGLYSVYSVY